MKLLLDTNVLIDYYAQREPFAADANKIVAAQLVGDVQLWTCPHSFPDISYILRRAIPIHELQKMMLSSLDFLEVCTVEHEDVKQSLVANWDDPEDALVERCAERIKADYLITRDKKGLDKAGVPSLAPHEWLDMMESTYGIVYESVEF